MDHDLYLPAEAAFRAGAPHAEPALTSYAELVRQHLGCGAVVIRIVGRFAALFAGDACRPPLQRRLPARLPAPPPARLPADIPATTCALARAASTPLPGLARRNPALLADPIAALDMGFAFYAGLPLRLSSGEALGTLAALDPAPRELARNELATLQMLASLVVQLAELRLAVARNGGTRG